MGCKLLYGDYEDDCMADNEANIYDGIIRLLQSLLKNPMAFVFLIGFFAGNGGRYVQNIMDPPRVDAYTGTMGTAERDARIAGDATLARATEIERKERTEEDTRIHTDIQSIKVDIKACQEYQHNHRVEVAQLLEKIKRLEEERIYYRGK